MEWFWSFIAFNLMNYAWLDALKLAIQNVFVHIHDLIVDNVVDDLIWFELLWIPCHASFDLPLISSKMMQNWVSCVDLKVSPNPESCTRFLDVQRLKMMWWHILIGPFEILVYLNFCFIIWFPWFIFLLKNDWKILKKLS